MLLPAINLIFSIQDVTNFKIVHKQLKKKKTESGRSVNQRWGPSSLVNRTTEKSIYLKFVYSMSGLLMQTPSEPASWWIVLRNVKSCFPKSTKGKYRNNEGDFHYNPKHPPPLSVLNHLRKTSIVVQDEDGGSPLTIHHIVVTIHHQNI